MLTDCDGIEIRRSGFRIRIPSPYFWQFYWLKLFPYLLIVNYCNFQFCESCGYHKKVRQKNYPPPPLLLSEIRYPGWVKIRIRDKHPGSATLLEAVVDLCVAGWRGGEGSAEPAAPLQHHGPGPGLLQRPPSHGGHLREPGRLLSHW